VTVSVILSTMRSGSTLLKALLAEAEDVSNLPEVNFQRFRDPRTAPRQIAALGQSPILVLKRPAWYHETGRYPRLPAVPEVRRIVLVRDVYETVSSLRNMTLRRLAPLTASLVNPWLIAYWTRVNERLWQLSSGGNENVVRVRYEDLVAQPRDVTRSLFSFLGSARRDGVETYQAPGAYRWRWGSDDGGDRIGSLRVLPPRKHNFEDHRLVRQIRKSPRTLSLRQQLMYPAFPPRP
jgi:hypothetical protein